MIDEFTSAELLPRDYRTPTNRLQTSCQETMTKMIEYLSFFLQCTIVVLLGAAAYCLYSLLEMAERSTVLL